MKTYNHILSQLAQFFLKWEMLQTLTVDGFKNTLLMFNFFFENLSLYEIRWKYIVDPSRP